MGCVLSLTERDVVANRVSERIDGLCRFCGLPVCMDARITKVISEATFHVGACCRVKRPARAAERLTDNRWRIGHGGAARTLPHDPLSDLVRLLFLWILGAANGELRLESAGSQHCKHCLIADLALELQDRMKRRLLDGCRAGSGSLGRRGPLLLRAFGGVFHRPPA
jgi:hypothetical protein